MINSMQAKFCHWRKTIGTQSL